MTGIRKCLVYSLILCFLATHFVSVIKRREWWPVSHYPMYASTVNVPITVYTLKGISSDPEEREITIPTEMIGAPRFVRIRFGIVEVVKWVNSGRSNPEVLEKVLADAAGLYNYHHHTGNSHIEKLRGMRLYRQVWARTGNSDGSRALQANAPASEWHLQSYERISEGLCKTIP